MTPEEERQLAVDLFNRAWTLMETDERTEEQDDELINTAHASAYHWTQVGTPANRARSEWQLSRVYTVLDRPSPRCTTLAGASPTARRTRRRSKTGTCPTPTRRSRAPMRSPARRTLRGVMRRRRVSWRLVSRAPRTASTSRPI